MFFFFAIMLVCNWFWVVVGGGVLFFKLCRKHFASQIPYGSVIRMTHMDLKLIDFLKKIIL